MQLTTEKYAYSKIFHNKINHSFSSFYQLPFKNIFNPLCIKIFSCVLYGSSLSCSKPQTIYLLSFYSFPTCVLIFRICFKSKFEFLFPVVHVTYFLLFLHLFHNFRDFIWGYNCKIVKTITF